MGMSERDASGSMLAKTNAVIWQSTANTILPEFQCATGAQLAPGIKLLVRARPVFKSLHGFTLEVDAIDPEYTLGDLEARKREIRERLQAEGVFAANRRLPAPWDFNAVLVVAPAGGAGLGDFQAEANQLERFGVCRFVYAYSRFQGEGAAREICDALQGALAAWDVPGVVLPDAVVIIRGSGAVNDMAWLNDYDLARLACDLPIPVFTGIGHERDGTVLDEVANTKFDTPSKVIAGIEQTIAKRTNEAKANVEQVMNRSARVVQSIKSNTVSFDATVRSEAIRHLAMGKQAIQTLINGIRLDAMKEVRSASELSLEKLQLVKTESLTQIAQAKQQVPMYWGQVSLGVKRELRSMSAAVDALVGGVLGQTRRDIVSARAEADNGLAEVASLARLMDRMESGDTLVVTKLDRIGRDSIDVQKTVGLFTELGVRLIVLQLGNLDLTSSSGALMVKVLAAVADFERELIIERTLPGQARARAAGTHMGRPSKTTDVQRQTIRTRLSSGQTVSAVARNFKLSRATVMGIRDAP